MGDAIRSEISTGAFLEAVLIDREDEPAPFLNVELSGERGDVAVSLWLMADGRILVTPEGLGPDSGEVLATLRPRR